MTKFCPKCGEENEDVAKFCGKCGYDFKDVDHRKDESKSKLSASKLFLGIIILVFIVILAAFMFTGGNGSEESQNITLIKENAYGFTFVNDGVPFYNYRIDGVITNLPDDFEGYDLIAGYYDKDGNLLEEYRDDYMKYIFSSSKKSQTDNIASIQTNEFLNVSYIQLEILNPNGTSIFNDTVEFDMAKMDLSGLDE